MRRLYTSWFFWICYSLLLVGVAVLGGVSGLLLGYNLDLPRVEELQRNRPNVVSYVYGDDGRMIGEFALEKRMLVTYGQIPETIRQAILAAEDSGFFDHFGVDLKRALVTVFRNIFYGQRKGASTLTMQLCKLRFTSSERRIERKIKDILFALETEKTFSKEQIFELYFNQVYMGHGIYGIAAATDFYFNKSLDELTLAESALLAGILNVPERYSPIRHPDRALRRRAYTLRRMHEEGYIDREAYAGALAAPLQAQVKHERRFAAYFVEWVRQHLEKNYATETIWQGGLKIYTTLNYDMQAAAQETLRAGLLNYDKKTRPWEGAPENLLDKELDMEQFYHADWRQLFHQGLRIHGLVADSDSQSATVKFGSYMAKLSPEDIAWTGHKRLDKALKKGDLAVFRLGQIDEAAKTLQATLERIPEVQAALFVLDNATGAIRAMVGGFDFRYSQFNRATQALRQPGSLFKPFTYAVALEEGKSPFDTLLDSPISFVDDLGRPYIPRNSDDEFKGLIPLYQALSESRNVPTLRLAKSVGIEAIIAMARRFGIERAFVPVLPIALGAGEITLQEITSAFSVIGNRGVRAHPYFISRVEDYHGQTLEEHQSRFDQVLSPEVCNKMLYLLQQVVQRGTAIRATALNRPLAGKTGTTNEATDAWFVGLTPQITAGVWFGFDEKKSLGEEIYGSNLALPVWLNFMQKVADRLPVEDFVDIYQPTELDLAMEMSAPEETFLGADGVAVEDIPPMPKIEEEDEEELQKPENQLPPNQPPS